MKRRVLAIVLLVAILFTSFASVSFAGTKKETGLYKVDGKWKYYENGKFTKATGLVMKPDKKTWHYVEKGVYKKVTGLVKCVQPGSSKGKWYYVYKGDLNKKATGLVKCVQPGKSKGKWYYVKNGKLKKITGNVKCIQPKSKAKGSWYHVKKGKKDYKIYMDDNYAGGYSSKEMYNESSPWRYIYIKPLTEPEFEVDFTVIRLTAITFKGVITSKGMELKGDDSSGDAMRARLVVKGDKAVLKITDSTWMHIHTGDKYVFYRNK